MKNTYFLTVFLLFSSFITLISCSKDDEPKNPEPDPNASINFPDANFKAALLEHGNTITGENISLIDTNNDGEIQISEAQNYSGLINVSNKQITDLTGLEHFKNIIKLFAYANQITQIDLSKNTELTHLVISENQIAQIDLSNNIKLTTLGLGNNQIVQIDLSKNTMLSIVSLGVNQIAQIDLSNNTELTELEIIKNQITQIDLSNNTELTYLDLRFNPNLTCIQIASGFTPTSSWYKDDTASYSNNCQ